MTTSANSPRRSPTASPRRPAPAARPTRFSAMNRLNCIPGCSGPDPWPVRRAPRAGVAFHKDPTDPHHTHDYMGGPGPARYAGSKRRVFTLGVAGPVGSGKTALVEVL